MTIHTYSSLGPLDVGGGVPSVFVLAVGITDGLGSALSGQASASRVAGAFSKLGRAPFSTFCSAVIEVYALAGAKPIRSDDRSLALFP